MTSEMSYQTLNAPIVLNHNVIPTWNRELALLRFSTLRENNGVLGAKAGFVSTTKQGSRDLQNQQDRTGLSHCGPASHLIPTPNPSPHYPSLPEKSELTTPPILQIQEHRTIVQPSDVLSSCS